MPILWACCTQLRSGGVHTCQLIPTPSRGIRRQGKCKSVKDKDLDFQQPKEIGLSQRALMNLTYETFYGKECLKKYLT